MKRSKEYPEPLVVEALTGHKRTAIILHGLGSNAEKFGPALLETKVEDNTFQALLPDVKFIFPTATFRRSTMAKRMMLTQWFDIAKLEDPSHRSEVQLEGLKESSRFIHQLLLKEISEVGASNVIVGGISQGCATSLISLLLWSGEPISAAFGMSGWLPFKDLFSSEEDDMFEQEETDLSPMQQGIQSLKEELDWEETGQNSFRTPIFLGHGAEDEKVPIELGKKAAETLQSLECTVEWHVYEGLAHWYSSEELGDLVKFLNRHMTS